MGNLMEILDDLEDFDSENASPMRKIEFKYKMEEAILMKDML